MWEGCAEVILTDCGCRAERVGDGFEWVAWTPFSVLNDSDGIPKEIAGYLLVRAQANVWWNVWMDYGFSRVFDVVMFERGG